MSDQDFGFGIVIGDAYAIKFNDRYYRIEVFLENGHYQHQFTARYDDLSAVEKALLLHGEDQRTALYFLVQSDIYKEVRAWLTDIKVL